MTTKTANKKPTTKKVTKPVVKSRAQVLRSKVKHHAKKALVPHKANDYRPHLVRAHGIIAVLVIAILAQVVYGFATTGRFEVLARVSNIETAELLTFTNDARTDEGLPELVLNDQLSQAAFLKAKDMMANGYWAHTSPDGVEPWKWFADAGYNYSVAGENLAKNYPDASATVKAWMNSPTHRDNIVNGKYADVGFAVVDGQLSGANTTLVVAMYGAPVTATALQQAGQTYAGFAAPAVAGDSTGPFSYFGSALQSLSPVTIFVLGLFALVAIVAVAAHHYRDKLPKNWKRSWKVHHGMFTLAGMITLGVLIVLATGGGQI